MEPLWILFAVFIIGLLIGMPVAIVMGISALAAILFTPEIPVVHMLEVAYGSADSFALIAIPMFLLAGYMMHLGGLAKRIIDFSQVLVGNMVGGLGATCIVSMVIFGAMSGSGPAATAAIGSLMIPAMLAAGYKGGYAEGLAASQGGIAIVIPPSVPLLIFGMLNQLSIPKLFLCGFIPGLLIAGSGLITNYFMARNRGLRGTGKRGSVKDVLSMAWKSKWALFAPVVILGSIYSGVVTVTEASVIAVLYAYFVGAFIYKELTWRKLKEALLTTFQVSGVILILLTSGRIFAQLIVWYKLPHAVAQGMLNFTHNPIFLILIMIGILLFIGMWMETIAQIFILSPIFLPIMEFAGMDPYVFGIVFIIGCEIGFDTPPLGANIFVAKELGTHTYEQISVYSIKFALSEIVPLIFIAFIPQLSLFLPNLLLGKL
jgi:C4-dicarboxylate transporter, DctM subunit